MGWGRGVGGGRDEADQPRHTVDVGNKSGGRDCVVRLHLSDLPSFKMGPAERGRQNYSR